MTHPPQPSLHLIADIAGCRHLDDPVLIEQALRSAAIAASATVLEVRLHHFGPQQGVTGVALLAESHISIHTWPENGLAAVDLFVCGNGANVAAGLAVIVDMLQGEVIMRTPITRLGRLPAASIS